MNDMVLAITVFVSVIVGVVFLRAKVGDKFEVKNSDILLALIPVAIWLVLTGKIQKLEFGEFKIEAAFVEASQSAVTPQIVPVKLPVEAVKMGSKGDIEAIPLLMFSKTEALVFQLGDGSYYGPVIEAYFNRLSRLPFFKYVVINQSDGTFVGLANAHVLLSFFSMDGRGYDDFARWIKESDLASLEKLPSYISSKNAIKKDTDKKTALEQMEALNSETLPVIEDSKKFVGVVDRSRLVSSLIIEVARKVK